MDSTIQLKDGYSVELDAVQHNFNVKVIYQFINIDGKKAKRFTDTKDPREISTNTAVGKELLKHIQDKKLSKIGIEEHFENLLIDMSDIVEEIIVAKNEAEEILEKAEEDVKQDEIDEGFETLDHIESPLRWIGNEIDWYTAGERMNILLAFIAGCSQVILQNPISVIPLGEGGAGKTHILETALMMIPDEFQIKIKSLTDAALFGFCDIDEYYLDGKIVNIGDMGGKDDHEEAKNFKNAMKEMQTDGYMARIKQVPKADGGYINQTYELKGYPCLAYTSVPGYAFDDQELSRSMLLTPRDDNNKAYMVFKRLNKQEGTPSAKLIAKHKETIHVIKKMVLALRNRMQEVKIYNPYWSFMETFLNDTKFLKRDVDKYDGILRVITCINGYNRELHEFEETQTLFTTKEDINMFLDLLERYYESITINLSPGASDVLSILRLNANNWGLYDEGLSVNEFMDKTQTKLSKRSVQRYFSELNGIGLLKVVDKVARSNLYALTSTTTISLSRDIKLSKLDIEVLEFNYGIDDLSKYEVDVSTYVSLSSCRDGNQPFWNKFLPEYDESKRQSGSGAITNGIDINNSNEVKISNNDNDNDLSRHVTLDDDNHDKLVEEDIKISREFDGFR